MMTKEEAEKKGREMLAMMNTGGWKLEVWENLGWHCALRNGYVNISHSNYGDGDSYLALVNDRGSGSHDSFVNAGGIEHHTDPNEAVESRLRQIEEWLDGVVTKTRATLAAARKKMKGGKRAKSSPR